MNEYLSKEEINKRFRNLALNISIDNIDNCIKTLQTIKRILKKKELTE